MSFTKTFFVLGSILVLAKLCAYTVDSAKILAIFQTPSQSHHILGSALLKELAKREHDVTMISPYPFKSPMKNYRDINLEEMHKFKEEVLGPVMNPNNSIFSMFKAWYTTVGPQLTELVWNNKDVQDLIKNKETFDAMIMIPNFYESYLGMAHHFNISSVILFAPFGKFPNVNRVTGNPSGVSYLPNMFLPLGSSEDGQNVPFITRVANVVITSGIYALNAFMGHKMDAILQKYLPNSPPISELEKNISLVLVNGHFSIDQLKAQVPNMISIGGFHIGEPKPLPTDIKQYLDDAKDGVILFSFGTNIKINSIKDKWDAIMNGLGKIAPIKVLFKSEVDIPNSPKNIRFEKWLPQSDILGHPNIKAFITHGGFGGITETIYNGVPILGIPFFGDQPSNVAENVQKGFGVQLKYDDLNEKSFIKALKEVLDNSIYSETIKKTSELLKDQPIKPMDNAIYWIEYVIRHKGAPHLRAGSSFQTWYQYYVIDVILFIVTILATLIYILFKLLTISFRFIKRKICTKKIKKH